MRQVEYIPGDKVFYNNMLFTIISSIMVDETPAYYIKNTDGVISDTMEEDLEGIPLTEEILSKNGWRKNSKGDHYFDSGNGTISIGPNQFKSILYVHQLQHLLFAFGFSMNLKV